MKGKLEMKIALKKANLANLPIKTFKNKTYFFPLVFGIIKLVKAHETRKH